VVNPQVDETGVAAVTVVRTGEGTDVGVTFPLEVKVQPAAKSAATSRRPQMQGMIPGCFMADNICWDICCGLYLWIYLTAKKSAIIPATPSG
jgi:hypothetical protein